MKRFLLKTILGAAFIVLLLRPVSWCTESIENLVLRGLYRETIQNYGADKNLTPTENYLLGLCYQETGELRKAEDVWQALLSGPERERSLLALAHLKKVDGALTESENIFRQFSREFPKSQYQPAALFGLAEVLSQKNKDEEKLKILNSLRRRYPFSIEAKKATQWLNQESGPYTIQIGSFADLNRAERVTEDLSSRGYEAYIARMLDNFVTYRVRIGNFKNKKEAESAGRNFKNNTGLDCFITK